MFSRNLGLGLFMSEKAKRNDRLARYYGELIGPAEANRRRAAGAQYIVRVNSNQYIDGEGYPQQHGRYANDGGRKNNAHIGTSINKCESTGTHWVSILARKSIKAGHEVYVPYGRNYPRSWRNETKPEISTNSPEIYNVEYNSNGKDKDKRPILDSGATHSVTPYTNQLINKTNGNI